MDVAKAITSTHGPSYLCKQKPKYTQSVQCDDDDDDADVDEEVTFTKAQEEKRMTLGNLFVIALCIEKHKTVLFYCYEAIDIHVLSMRRRRYACVCFSFACTSGGCATTWIALFCVFSDWKHVNKFIIIGSVVMKTCAHCAILCTALACTGEDCVIHAIVLVTLSSGWHAGWKFSETIGQTNQTTLLLLRNAL